MYRFLGTMMYNSKELLRAREIARENKAKEDQVKVDKAKDKEIAFFRKAEEAHLVFQEQGHLLGKLNLSELQDIVCYLCCVENKKGDAYSNHSGSKKKLKERIAAVEPPWTKYFEPPPAAEEEEEEEVEDVPQRRRSHRTRRTVRYKDIEDENDENVAC